MGDSFEQCKGNIDATRNLLTSLEFIINMNKSRLKEIPPTKCQFLGLRFCRV